MAFGGNVPDENLVPGFTVQNAGGGVNYSASYVPTVATLTTVTNGTPGYGTPVDTNKPALNNVAQESAYYTGATPSGNFTVTAVTSVKLAGVTLVVVAMGGTIAYVSGGTSVPAGDVVVGSVIPAGATVTTTGTGNTFAPTF